MEEITGARYLAEAFEAFGVRAVFFVPTMLSRTLYELECHTNIKRVMSHGEKASAYMADGYARASGRVGVCFSQNVGATNLAAGLRDAYLGGSPVLALTGGPFVSSQGRNYYQECVNLPVFSHLTKWSERVPNVKRLPDMLDNAFRVATTGSPGPVHLELPGHAAVEIEDALFSPAAVRRAVRQVPALRCAADDTSVNEAVALLRSADRPVIVAGGGVRQSDARRELVELAEALGAPVATSLNAKDTLPGGHNLSIGTPGLYARQSTNEILLESDLVLFVGSKTGSQVTLDWTVPPLATRVIHMDIDPSQPGRHYPETLPLVADAKIGLGQLVSALANDPGRKRDQWVSRARELTEHWRHGVARDCYSDQVPIRPERLSTELSHLLPTDAMLVCDTGHSGMWMAGYVDLIDDQHFLRAAGSLGWGLPAALGAQLAVPERRVVLFTGDGGLFYHLAELETAARWNIPVVVVINNNKALNQEINPYTRAYGGTLHGRHGELWRFHDVSFADIATAMGVMGITVTKPTELSSAMDQALSHDGPVVLDILTDIEVLAPRGVAERSPV